MFQFAKRQFTYSYDQDFPKGFKFLIFQTQTLEI